MRIEDAGTGVPRCRVLRRHVRGMPMTTVARAERIPKVIESDPKTVSAVNAAQEADHFARASSRPWVIGRLITTSRI